MSAVDLGSLFDTMYRHFHTAFLWRGAGYAVHERKEASQLWMAYYMLLNDDDRNKWQEYLNTKIEEEYNERGRNQRRAGQ